MHVPSLGKTTNVSISAASIAPYISVKTIQQKRAAFSFQDLIIYVLQPKYIMSSIAGSCHLVMVTHKEQWQ